ncbi:MAG: hypothetical protein ABIS67_14020 [Candidatus Eisenbacteria bacterium]
MKSLLHNRRIGAVLMLGVIATTLLAPLAEAGHGRGNGRGNGRRWKHAPVVVREVHHSYPVHASTRVSYVRRQSNAGPILAGIVGGLVLGAALSHAQPSVRASYSYYDPYCEESYGSLERYRSHSRGCDHPQVVRVIEVSSGDCVRDLCWRDNGWRDYDGGRNYDDGRCYDDGRRYEDNRYEDDRYRDDRDWDDD